MMWVDLAPYWDDLRRLGAERHGQKAAFASSNLWTKKHTTHFYGLCGEAVVALLSGLRVDRKLRINGDPGFDFRVRDRTYDVKTSTFISDPHLKEFIDKNKWADVYILVALDLNKKRGKVVGWADLEQLMAAERHNYGYGERFCIPSAKFEEWEQMGLPAALNGKNGR